MIAVIFNHFEELATNNVLDNWGGGAIFIYSCSQTLKTIDFKRN
jgi:hypothetical protein